jgi:anti-sigma B factor antagonist
MSIEFWIKDLRKDETIVVVGLGGRLGASPAQKFMAHCHKLLDSGRTDIVVDMSEVNFIASSGAGTLVVLSEQFRAHNGTVQILNASDTVRHVIELLNLDPFVVLVESVEEAIANLQKSAV